MPGVHGAEWVKFEEFDTSEPVNGQRPEDSFEPIGREFLASGRGTVGAYGATTATRLDGRQLADFGVAWLDR